MNNKPELLIKKKYELNQTVFILLVQFIKSVQFLSIVFIIYYPRVIFSQTPPYYHYTSSEGLASSSVNDMIQDRNGFMWFATVSGVSRFDGHKFIKYTTSDGLNSNSIISLIEDSGGCIYFGNELKGFNIYSDGKIETYSTQTLQNPVIKGMFLEGNKLYSYVANNISQVSPESIRNLFFLNLGDLPDSIGIYEIVKVYGGSTLAATKKGLYNIENPEKEKIKTIGVLPDSIGINKIFNLNNGSVIAATTKGLYKFENQELKKIKINGFDDQEIFWLSSEKDNNLILGSKGKIYEVNNDTVIRMIDVDLHENNNVVKLLKDTKGNIWFSIMNKGFFFIKNGTNRIENIGIKTGFEKSIVNKFLEDNEGNIWVSTFGDGVICLNNLYLKNFSLDDGLSNNKVLAIEKDQSDRLYIGTFNGLNVLENDSFNIIPTGANYNYSSIYGIKNINDSVYVCGNFSYSADKSRIDFKNDKLYLIRSPSFCITQNRQYISGGWDNYIQFHSFTRMNLDLEKTYIYGENDWKNKVYSILEDTQNNLWVCTTWGLCEITNGQKNFFRENEILSTIIMSIIQDHNDHVWFAGDKGIASYGLKDSLITNYSKISGYDLSSSGALAVDKYNRLWIGSMKGLFILNKDDNDSLFVLNKETGLPSNEIYSLYCDTVKNIMWIGSANGLSSLDISEFDNEKISPVNVMIRKISSGDSVYTKFVDINLKPKQNNLHIELTTANYSSPATVKYQYKLEDEWTDISDDYINFQSLENGDYRLEIRGKAINRPWGKSTLVTFTMLPRFFESQPIREGIVFLFVIGFLYGASKRIQYIKKRNDEKLVLSNQINDLKHKALSSMMNPHFIFNSLNSVQYLINSDKKREANDYISLMARLIRMNLESASESYIRLEDEIKRLGLYLQIEKLRFCSKFNYEIFTGNDIDPGSIMIPNMIIQPFVENSIWHGIMPSGREGFIKISFNFEKVNVDNYIVKFLTIRITDNGIGLSESQKSKKEGHVSMGIQIIQDRLILLSKEQKLPKPIFEDLSLKNKNIQGTEVVLSIPPELYRIISN